MSFLGALLSRQDRVYLLSLLVPFAIYNLALKAYDVASRPEKLGLARTLKLMRSDVFYNLGYALLWNGLFGAARRRRPLRRAVVFILFSEVRLSADAVVSVLLAPWEAYLHSHPPRCILGVRLRSHNPKGK